MRELVSDKIDGWPEESSSLSADDWFKHLPKRGSFGGDLYDRSQLDSLLTELSVHGVELHPDADQFLAERGIAGGFHAIGPGKAKFYIKAYAT